MKEREEASSSDVKINKSFDEAPTPPARKSNTGRGRNDANPMSGGRGRNTSAITAIFWILLIFGFSQILLYHPGSFQDEHWFDHSNWKLPSGNRNNNRGTTVSSNRSRQGISTPVQLKVVSNEANTTIDSDLNEGPKRSVDKNNTEMVLAQGLSPKSKAKALDNPIMQILISAGLNDIDPKDLAGLPSPEALSSLYGPLKEPIVVGMDTCATYRNKVAPSDRIAAVAGLFNTGTNAMEFHLRNNVNIKNTWQVPWGKHRMEFVRMNHTAAGLDHVNKHHVLPIVLIREPLYWMQRYDSIASCQTRVDSETCALISSWWERWVNPFLRILRWLFNSMCKSPYAAHWPSTHDHCPNLVPNEADQERFREYLNATTHDSFQVKVIFDKNQTFYWDSLAHLWSHWYRLYLNAEYPRLMVRFEDLLFHGPVIMKRIAECAGVTVPEKFQFQTGSAKGHGSHATFLDAIIKTGDLKKRLRNFTPQDLEYATHYLDQDLMRIFRYALPDPSSVS